jgi:hypothetical protein
MLMLNKRKEKEAQLEKDSAESGDPYFRYGFGLIAYRNTLFNLCVAFAVFSLLAWPMASSYASGSAWKQGFSKFGKYSIGNLGYNTVQCKNMQLIMKTYQLSCPYGKIDTLVDFGMNPQDSEHPVACL